MTAKENQDAVNRLYLSSHVTKIDARVRKIRRAFRQFVALGAEVLDVGCGDGVILSPFVRDYRIDGVECFEPFCLQALQRGYRKVENFDLNLPWPTQSPGYDAVFSGETSEHQTDVDLFLSEVNRVLKPGGWFIYTFPNIRTVIGIAMMVFQNRPPMSSARYRSPHFKDFTTATARLALRNNGFRIVEMLGSSLGTTGFDFLPRLASYLSSWSVQVVTVAQKQEFIGYDGNAVGDMDIYRVWAKSPQNQYSKN